MAGFVETQLSEEAVRVSKLHADPNSTDLFAEQVRTIVACGGMETVWLQSAEFPWASVARHVRVARTPSAHDVLVEVSTIAIVTLALFVRSMALGGSKIQPTPQATVLLLAHVSDGGVVSTTEMVCEHAA